MKTLALERPIKPTLTLTALLLAPLAVLHAQDTTSSPPGPPPGTKWKLGVDVFTGKKPGSLEPHSGLVEQRIIGLQWLPATSKITATK